MQQMCEYCGEKRAVDTCEMCGSSVCAQHNKDYGCAVCGGEYSFE